MIAMKQAKVPVSTNVLEGLEAVRLSGKTNMLDLPEVVRIAVEMDFIDTAMWIENNRSLYAQGVFWDFEPTDSLSGEGGDKACADR